MRVFIAWFYGLFFLPIFMMIGATLLADIEPGHSLWINFAGLIICGIFLFMAMYLPWVVNWAHRKVKSGT